jgi:hypothetical protein
MEDCEIYFKHHNAVLVVFWCYIFVRYRRAWRRGCEKTYQCGETYSNEVNINVRIQQKIRDQFG